MEEFLGMRLIGAMALGLAFAMAARAIVRPAPKLAGRVRPYTAGSRSSLGNVPERAAVTKHNDEPGAKGVLLRIYRPILDVISLRFTKLFGSMFDDDNLALRLRQAGVLLDVPDSDRVHEHRVRQIGAALTWGCGLATLAALSGGDPAAILGLFVLGVITGAARKAATIGSRIERRRERMRVELYTINQLLAIYLRTSGSPVLAAQRLVRRGRGAVIDELDEALRLHTRGMSASKAFLRIAEQTPEPFAARTYKLLASGSERGADLAAALLSLSEDVREDRRTNVRRRATRRQATMLVPIICFLAPVMLIFLAVPLPELFFSGTP